MSGSESSTVFQVCRVRRPRLQDAIANRFAALNFSSLSIEKLGKERWPVGFEQEIWLSCREQLTSNVNVYDTLGHFGITFDPKGAMALDQRPPSELAAYFLWQLIRNEDLGLGSLLEVNRLLGGSISLRGGSSLTTPFRSGERLAFDCRVPADAFIMDWLAKFNVAYPQSSACQMALWLYVDFVLAHPFIDGNGRTARLLFQAFLHRNGMLQAPLLPLGPWLAMNKKKYLNAAWRWQFLGESSDFYDLMLSGIELTEHASRSLMVHID